MGDAQWREAERRWRASPSDATLAEAIKVGRRHGVRIPGAMLLAQRFPRRTLNCKEPGWVQVETDTGTKTIGATPADPPLTIPRSRMVWFHPEQGTTRPIRLDALVRLAARESIPGIGVHLPVVTDVELRRLLPKASQVHGLWLHEAHESSLPRQVTTEVLGAIAGLPDLHCLRMTLETVTGGAPFSFAPLREQPHLVDVQANSMRTLDAEAGEALPRHVRRLVIQGPERALFGPTVGVDAALKGFGALEELAELELVYTDATDAGLTRLLVGAGPRLERLSLEACTRVTGESLSGLDAPRLESLDLHSTAVTARALAHLAAASVPALTRLDLTGCKGVNDAGLRHVGKLGTLRELVLDHCSNVTSTGLGKLAALEGLERLYLRGSPTVLKTWVKGRDEIRSALPNCKIF